MTTQWGLQAEIPPSDRNLLFGNMMRRQISFRRLPLLPFFYRIRRETTGISGNIKETAPTVTDRGGFSYLRRTTFVFSLKQLWRPLLYQLSYWPMPVARPKRQGIVTEADDIPQGESRPPE